MAVLAEISAVTRNMVAEPDMDLIEFEHAAFDILWEKKRITDEPGRGIELPTRYQRLPGGAFEYYDELSVEAVPQFKVPEVAWKNHYITIAISSEELIQTVRMDADDLMKKQNTRDLGGEKTNVLVNLIQRKMESAPMDMRQQLAEALWADGSGNDGKNMDGIGNIIRENTASYAGLAVGDLGVGKDGNNFWASILSGTSGNTDLLTFGNIRTDRATILNGRAVKNDTFFGFCSPTIFGGLEMALAGQAEMDTGTAAELGFSSIKYRNLIFVEDADAVSDGVLYLNTRYFQIYVDSVWNMKLTDWVKPVDQEAIVARLLVRCQAVCPDRRRHGYRQGITL